ncbi:MAG: hypothetical protein QOI66_3021 [Myxococcales bacterium]|nr:hypothetical protein [Myxococcales bacterium]
MKTISILFLLSSLTFGCASTRLASSTDAATARRGSVVVEKMSVKAVVAGPVDIHAYSAFAGGTLYLADAVTGTDRDCAPAATAGAGMDSGAVLRADRIENVAVAEGKVACLATSGQRSIEVLWHARKGASPPPLVANNR